MLSAAAAGAGAGAGGSAFSSAGAGAGGPASAIDIAKACCSRRSSSSSTELAMTAAAESPPMPDEAAAPPPACPSAPGAAAASPASAPPPSLWALAIASCLARSSSIDTRRAMASSGSRLGSMPPKSPAPPPPLPAPPAEAAAAAAIMPAPPSCSTGEFMRTSLGSTPAGTVIRWLFSDEFAASTKSCNFSWFSSSSPKLITSTATLFFLRSLPTLMRAFFSSRTGLPTKITTRCPPCLFRRCFSASCAICTAAARLRRPCMGTSCSEARILPMSSVGLTSSSTLLPAMLRTPTVLSGFD
mmetsp:Transcript_6628/g.10011  ORF Transcript_6628/g.10011 Transcript_6628/m.10011 type:complete len:300 (-) Transcript_6628:214-1113(-)